MTGEMYLDIYKEHMLHDIPEELLVNMYQGCNELWQSSKDLNFDTENLVACFTYFNEKRKRNIWFGVQFRIDQYGEVEIKQVMEFYNRAACDLEYHLININTNSNNYLNN